MKLTRHEAETQGYTVDTHCHPAVAYRGPRFAPTELHEISDEIAKVQTAVEELQKPENSRVALLPKTESIDGAWSFHERSTGGFWWIKGDSAVFVGSDAKIVDAETDLPECKGYIASGSWRRVLPSEMTAEQRKAIGVDEAESIDGDWTDAGHSLFGWWKISGDSILWRPYDGVEYFPSEYTITEAREYTQCARWRRISPAEIAERQAKARGETTAKVDGIPVELAPKPTRLVGVFARADHPQSYGTYGGRAHGYVITLVSCRDESELNAVADRLNLQFDPASRGDDRYAGPFDLIAVVASDAKECVFSYPGGALRKSHAFGDNRFAASFDADEILRKLPDPSPEQPAEKPSHKAEGGLPPTAVCLFMDGNQVCAVYPDFINLQESPAGFGNTYAEAIDSLHAIMEKGRQSND